MCGFILFVIFTVSITVYYFRNLESNEVFKDCFQFVLYEGTDHVLCTEAVIFPKQLSYGIGVVNAVR